MSMELEKQDMKDVLSMEMFSNKGNSRRPIFLIVHALILTYRSLHKNIHHIFEFSVDRCYDIVLLTPLDETENAFRDREK